MLRKRMKGETRSEEQLREHYEIEKELAARLRDASPDERLGLYSSVYDELFRRVPDHPQLVRKESSEGRRKSIGSQMGLLRPFLTPQTTFLEIGAGDCALSFEAAKAVRKVYAVDVSETIARRADAPENFELALSDGCSIPVPPNSVDVAYSNQLMEHLHPDDARTQLKNIHAVLAPGGRYFCITPNSLGGPWDISKYFDDVATGFHLKEYTIGELARLFRSAGFSRIESYVGARGRYRRFPLALARLVERALEVLPGGLRRRLARSFPLRLLLRIQLAGIK